MSEINLTLLAKTLLAYGYGEKALNALQQQLSVDANHREAQLLLADTYRRKGDFVKATECYRQLHREYPADNNILYMLSIFQTELHYLLPAPNTFRPAPFVKVPEFLNECQWHNMLTNVIANESAFVPAKVASDTGCQPEIRMALVLQNPSLVTSIKKELTYKLEAQLPDIHATLGKEYDSNTTLEIKVSAYTDGCFFKVHRDNADTIYQHQDTKITNSNRIISFVYYFFEPPQHFRGGDLLLHDTNVEKNRYSPEHFTRFVAENNMALFFPSEVFHQVTPVSMVNTSFSHARFALVGHLRVSVKR